MTSTFSIRQRITMDLAHGLVARRPGDQYIASYPRSGNTWLRRMLVNATVPDAHSNPAVFNRVLPGVTLRDLPKVNELTGPRILKTHSWYRPQIKRAVYLVRDGRDATVSYYHYLITRQGLAGKVSFSDFFADYCAGNYGELWHQNVISWLQTGRKALGERLLVIHFEDMKEDPIGALGSVMEFLGLKADPDSLEQAVQESSLENARELEKRRRGGISDPNMLFNRQGVSNGWRAVFTAEQEDRFRQISCDALQLAGYPL